MLIRYSTGITAIKTQVKYLNFGSLILSFVLQEVQRALIGEHSIRQKLCVVPQLGQLNLSARLSVALSGGACFLSRTVLFIH